MTCQVNCEKFERDVADWASGRLCAESAWRMANHTRECAACARIIFQEQRLRDVWQETRECSMRPDLWPQLAAGLALTQQRRVMPAGRYVMAFSGAAVVICLTLFGRQPLAVSQSSQNAVVEVSAIPQSNSEAWPLLPRVSPAEPNVDDPTGASMDEVWTQIKTGSASPEGE